MSLKVDSITTNNSIDITKNKKVIAFRCSPIPCDTVEINGVTKNYSTNKFNISFGNKSKFCTKSYLKELSKIRCDESLPTSIVGEKLKLLDNLAAEQKRQFLQDFQSLTGFPDLSKVTGNIEREIHSSIHKLARQEKFDVVFIGYDSNCSVGRKIPFPGSDCDGLFMIINPKANKEPWFPGKIRWDLKDHINQRILSTPAEHLPEVLSIDFIERGLEIGENAFKKCNFSEADLKRFEELLKDNTGDYVKSAEFNIRMAQQMPKDTLTREQYYKTAMLAEIIRDGRIQENNFDKKLYDRIMNSQLYKYSNIMKQKGLKNSLKSKYIERKTLKDDFNQMSLEEQFQLIKDILYVSFNRSPSGQNKKYFSNINKNNTNEMGNIEKMYRLINGID